MVSDHAEKMMRPIGTALRNMIVASASPIPARRVSLRMIFRNIELQAASRLGRCCEPVSHHSQLA